MNLPPEPFFAAGLFDSPWVVMVLILGSALINWLTKRREEAQAAQQPPAAEEAEPPAGQPQNQADLEEMLRRLMGEPPKAPGPPPLPPGPAWEENEPPAPARQTVPQMRLRPPGGRVAAYAGQEAQAKLRFEHLKEQGRRPATVVGRRQGGHSQTGPRGVSPWRDRRQARQAFVASLVFAPPKGLES